MKLTKMKLTKRKKKKKKNLPGRSRANRQATSGIDRTADYGQGDLPYRRAKTNSVCYIYIYIYTSSGSSRSERPGALPDSHRPPIF
ncbi:hypothetical protein H112_01287 [Trichophyton rubrum D6]|uniref:Uncharacterized protein n=2 Tax=Trichophyton TaxID=5550 RepID=A0A022WD87_TRIRU|nr:hypothetical protein H100_01282 [Trichophyton rubrum MR850]EZF45638.1 hypothetical protein H102_01277 [Trichophyton rubrum CBS 100081]EZF56284.1 hypothetical protein H103_01286 [Trichophyton rubrum CBS 288.86]EZF66904.1 hypothetical protein H104_01270 [Trichophyton rubrum CBS 289.86]EZF77552.1 hypothetical protein H105_01291 [Trichophyton soudanense CBS 452.61]EZF88197.1 hypothetical protein H110_01286 [Trichophyton rubrum MR1448]EZF98972.1 hypothetical protein H113_01286 [Trichophyton rub